MSNQTSKVPKCFDNKRLFTQMLVVYCIAFVAMVVVLAIAKLNGISTGLLLIDPAVSADYPVYVGMLSTVGILIWCATAAICLFSASILTSQTSKRQYWRNFLAISGLLTLWLAIDDLWLIHENYDVWLRLDRLSLIIPGFIPGYIFDFLLYGLYGSFVGAYFYYFRKIFRQTPLFAFLIALACFGCSIIIDIVGEMFSIRHHHVPEDIFKMLGIVGWLFYFSWTCRQALQRSNHRSS